MQGSYTGKDPVHLSCLHLQSSYTGKDSIHLKRINARKRFFVLVSAVKESFYFCAAIAHTLARFIEFK
jgi:hypothetical protein